MSDVYVRAGLDDLVGFVIFVIVIVVVNVFKKIGSSLASSKEGAEAARPSFAASQSELNEFLRKIGKAIEEPGSVAPPPPPVRQTGQKPAARRLVLRSGQLVGGPARAVAGGLATAVSSVEASARGTPDAVLSTAGRPISASKTTLPHAGRRVLPVGPCGVDSGDRDALRGAIVAREILGPPISLKGYAVR